MTDRANRLTAISLPIPWLNLGLPERLELDGTTMIEGDPAWLWSGATPELRIPPTAGGDRPGERAPGWSLDHVVVLVPDLGDATARFVAAGLTPRLEMTVRDRKTAFYRAGPEIEVIESPVREPALYGVALATEEPLEIVVLRWRSMGRDVGDPAPALQPDRRIFTVRDVEAGLAVMSPRRGL